MKHIIAAVLLIVIPVVGFAKPAPELVDAVQSMFPSSDEHQGLMNSQHRLEMSKVSGFAVTKKADMPAGTAFWFITKQHYDFRPFIVKQNSASTFSGKPDVVLPAGTIMVVVSTEVFRKTIQIKLLTVDIITESGATPTRRDTRGAVALTFKFPELGMTASDVPIVLDRIQQYIVPASSIAQANQIAAALRSGITPVVSNAAASQKPTSESKVSPTEVPVEQLPKVAPPSTGTVLTGMSYDEVKKIKGTPLRTITRNGQVVFDYNDHEIIFVQDKVYDIRWK